MQTLIAFIGAAAQEVEENAPEDLYPHWEELIVGALAFFILFFFMGRWVLPRVSKMLEERRARIQGELEKAERDRREAEELKARYEEQLREARSEAARIIDDARKTAESMRKDILAKAEDESREVVARAQEEIKAERAQTFDALRRDVGELSVDLAARVIGDSLDKKRQAKLVDDYIDELAKVRDGQGNGSAGSPEGAGARSSARSSSGRGSSAKSSGGKGSSSKSRSSKGSSSRSGSSKGSSRSGSARKRKA